MLLLNLQAFLNMYLEYTMGNSKCYKTNTDSWDNTAYFALFIQGFFFPHPLNPLTLFLKIKTKKHCFYRMLSVIL